MTMTSSSSEANSLCSSSGFFNLYSITDQTELDGVKNLILSYINNVHSPDYVFDEDFYMSGNLVAGRWQNYNQIQLYSEAVPSMPWNENCLAATSDGMSFRTRVVYCEMTLKIICEYWALPPSAPTQAPVEGFCKIY